MTRGATVQPAEGLSAEPVVQRAGMREGPDKAPSAWRRGSFRGQMDAYSFGDRMDMMKR